MGKRYGRNQKRKHRNEIADLKSRLDSEIFMRRCAEAKSQTARQDALDRFMKDSGLMREAVNRIAYELGRAVGKELEPYAKKLLDYAQKEHEDYIDFTILDSPALDRKVDVLRGEIKRLIYNVVLY
jgi:hypothetical protein